jgi:hypothetical protein
VLQNEQTRSVLTSGLATDCELSEKKMAPFSYFEVEPSLKIKSVSILCKHDGNDDDLQLRLGEALCVIHSQQNLRKEVRVRLSEQFQDQDKEVPRLFLARAHCRDSKR